MLLKLVTISCVLLYLAAASPQKPKRVELKYHHMTHSQIVQRNARVRQSASANAHPKGIKHGRYLAPALPFDYIGIDMVIGTPDQYLDEVSLSTELIHVWLAGPEYGGNVLQRYDPGNSNTSTKQQGESSEYIKELDGNFYGEQYTDFTRRYGEFGFNFRFNVFESIDLNAGIADPDFSFSGFLGLAWNTSEPTRPNINSSFIRHALYGFEESLYSIWLERESLDDGTPHIRSFVEFGDPDEWYCKKDLEVFPVQTLDEKSPLVFTVEGFKFGKYEKKKNWHASLASGFSTIVLPQSLHDTIINQLPAAWDEELNLYLIDCDQAKLVDDWVFTINGHDYPLPPSQYIVDIGAPGEKCVATFEYNIYSAQIDIYFGLPMFFQYCTVFDPGHNLVGLSTAIHETNSTNLN